MDFKDAEAFREELDRALMEELSQRFSPILVEHVLRPRNVGDLENPDGEATLTGICEDTVRIQLRLNGERIDEIRFMTNGCGGTMACGSMATELAAGRTLQEALKLDGAKIVEMLQGLPIEHRHCADLAANTVKAAARDALEKRREPWKRLYRPSGQF
jgi:nitrogen fixation NifU-like protein